MRPPTFKTQACSTVGVRWILLLPEDVAQVQRYDVLGETTASQIRVSSPAVIMEAAGKLVRHAPGQSRPTAIEIVFFIERALHHNREAVYSFRYGHRQRLVALL